LISNIAHAATPTCCSYESAKMYSHVVEDLSEQLTNIDKNASESTGSSLSPTGTFSQGGPWLTGFCRKRQAKQQDFQASISSRQIGIFRCWLDPTQNWEAYVSSRSRHTSHPIHNPDRQHLPQSTVEDMNGFSTGLRQRIALEAQREY